MKCLFIILTIILLTTSSFKSGEKSLNTSNSLSVEGFVLPVYTQLPLGAVRPGGWLLHQLQIMRDESSQLSSGFIWNLAHVPGELITTGRRIPAWQLLNDVAPIPVTDRNGLFKGEVNDSIETITLVPYGFTKVRIVAFPIVP